MPPYQNCCFDPQSIVLGVQAKIKMEVGKYKLGYFVNEGFDLEIKVFI